MSGFFEGWYFKQQTDNGMLALIPAFHTDGRGNRTASLQLVTADEAWYVPFPEGSGAVRRQPITVRVGASAFSLRGFDLNLRSDQLTAVGRLRFRCVTPPRGDIMGPYRFVPLLECRHSVFSMTHQVDGRVVVNGATYDFADGVGYVEGDRGRSFPKRYVWAQCSWWDGGPCALMLSAADVRPLGREFVGVIGFVCLRGRELRLATYRGARVVSLGGGVLIVRQGAFSLTAALLEDGAPPPLTLQALRAPRDGEMARRVRERLSCRARFVLKEKDDVLFDFVSEQASFEYEF